MPRPSGVGSVDFAAVVTDGVVGVAFLDVSVDFPFRLFGQGVDALLAQVGVVCIDSVATFQGDIVDGFSVVLVVEERW